MPEKIINSLIKLFKHYFKKITLHLISNYKYALLLLLVLPIFTICAPFLGIQMGKQFIFYRLFGIMRSEIFVYSLYLLFTVITLIIFTRGFYLFGFKKFHLYADEIIKWLFFFTILSWSSFNYLFWGIRYGFNSFEFPSYTNLPNIINDINNGILNNDFFTKAISSTPRFITTNFLKIPTYFGFDWYDGIHFFTVCATIIIFPILFLSLDKIMIRYFGNKHITTSKLFLYRAFLFLLIISKIILSLQNDRSLMGWDSAFFFYVVEPDEYALIFGLLFLKYFFDKKNKLNLFFCFLFLAICTFFHVLYGLAIFSIMIIYFFPIKNNDFFIRSFYCLIIGIFIPTIILFFKYENPNPISPEKFIYLYNLTTHAFHYKISDLIGITYINWIICYLVHLIISLKLKSSKLVNLSCLSILFLIIPIVIQYLGTEVYKIKIIGTLGLNRFTAFNSMIFCFNSIIILANSPLFNWFDKSFRKIISLINNHLPYQNINKNVSFLNTISRTTFYFFLKPRILIATSMLIAIGIWHNTKHNPLENRINFSPWAFHDKYNSLSTLCNWIRNNIPDNSIIFVHHEDNVLLNTGVSFAIKCFGQRATFADFAFPFNESYLIEWDKRLNYHRNFNLLTLDEFISMCDSYSVTHLLRINHKNNIKNFPSIWKSEEFIIHEINQLKNIKQNLN